MMEPVTKSRESPEPTASAIMDDQTRLARFESMRRNPGTHKSRNKQLFMVHKDLEKQCVRHVKRHEFDIRITTAEINRQKTMMEVKQSRLKQQQQRIEYKREQTHMMLERMQHGHVQRERTYIRELHVQPSSRISETDIVRAINKLAMPSSMKRRLKMQAYSTNEYVAR